MFLGEDAIRPHSLDVILNLLSWFPSAAPLLLVQRILLGTFRKLLLLRCWRTASSAKDTILALYLGTTEKRFGLRTEIRTILLSYG